MTNNNQMRHLKQTLILTLLIFTFFNSYSQFERKYRSKESDAYYDSIIKTRKSEEFAPVSIEAAKRIPFDHLKIIKVDKPAVYNPNQVYTPYYDSVMKSLEGKMEFQVFDSILQLMQNEKIGIIPAMSVIKHEKAGDNWAIIYADMKYDDFVYGGIGYWIALSHDNGNTWKKYYTGLSENYYYFFKRNSIIPLWKDSVTLQIESAVVRQTSRVSHPLPASFETVQDSIAVLIDIRKINQDTDNDGLTDIEEDKMMLNPDNPDTDSDGIIDCKDKNPRFKSTRTDKSLIYEVLVNNYPTNEKGEWEIDLMNPPTFEKSKADTLFPYFESVNLFVTDDKELQQLNLYEDTMIIMTGKEYEEYKLRYPSHFIKSSYTRMFKCDWKKKTYIIDSSHLTSSTTYAVERTSKGWKISIIMILIS